MNFKTKAASLLALFALVSSSAFAVADLPGDIIITEWQANPAAVADSNGEYVEFYNTTGFDIDINGWTIKDDGTNTHIIANGGQLLVPAGGFLVIGNDTNSATNGGITNEAYSYGSAITMGNSADEIVLLDSGATEICRVNYTNGDPAGTGVAMELDDIVNHTDGVTLFASYNGAPSTYGDGDNGSPGAFGATVPVEVSAFEID